MLPKRSSASRTALVVSLSALALYTFPLALHHLPTRTPIDTSQPLKQQAIRRGAFNNSGSRDIGPDPDWQDGVHKSKLKRAARANTNTAPTDNTSQRTTP